MLESIPCKFTRQKDNIRSFFCLKKFRKYAAYILVYLQLQLWGCTKLTKNQISGRVSKIRVPLYIMNGDICMLLYIKQKHSQIEDFVQILITHIRKRGNKERTVVITTGKIISYLLADFMFAIVLKNSSNLIAWSTNNSSTIRLVC